MSEETDCLICEAGTYNDLEGQAGCMPCGAYADSIEGSTTCECIGDQRVYSKVDGSCRCQTGYDYLNPDTLESEGT